MGAARCSQGRLPRTITRVFPPKAFPDRSAFLTADVADGADEEMAVSLSELPVLLFQATWFVTRPNMACMVATTDGHGFTRIQSFAPINRVNHERTLRDTNRSGLV